MQLAEISELPLIWGMPSKAGLKEIKQEGLVLIPEMRPYLLGLKVAEILNNEGLKTIYVTDNMLGLLFYKGKIREVLFFYKKRQKDHFLGLSGSLYVCLLAKLHQVPVKPLKGEAVDLKEFDQDASTIDGHLLFKGQAIEAKEECLPLELIQ